MLSDIILVLTAINALAALVLHFRLPAGLRDRLLVLEQHLYPDD